MFVCFFLSCAMQHAGSRPFFNWGWGVLMLSWMSSFMSSSDILFANIFSHSVGCLWWFPSLQKRFSFMRSRLLIFASVALAWGDRSKKYCKGWCQGAYYCLCFLKFTYVHGMRKCSSFVLLHVAIQFSQHHWLKELSLPLCIFCLLHCRLIDCMCVDLFLGSLFCSIDLCVWFVPVRCYFDYYSFCSIVSSAAAAAVKSLQSCPTLCDPIDGSPPGFPRPWDSLGKNTGVGCHFLLQRMKVKSESEVIQSCPTLSDPMDWSPPGSSINGIFQARVLEWGAIHCLLQFCQGSV